MQRGSTRSWSSSCRYGTLSEKFSAQLTTAQTRYGEITEKYNELQDELNQTSLDLQQCENHCNHPTETTDNMHIEITQEKLEHSEAIEQLEQSVGRL